MKTSSPRLFALLKPGLAVAAAIALLPFLAMPALAATGSTSSHLHLVSAKAKLITTLNTQRAKKGEPVTAKLMSDVKASDSMNLPKGTILLGKVEQVQRSSNKGPAKLSVVFNEAKLHNGHLVPIKATLLGAFPVSSWDSYNFTGVGGPYIGLHSGYIPDNQRVDQEAGTISHVAMHSAVQSPVSGIFSSRNRNFKLHRGTELQFAIAPMSMAKKG